MLLVAPLLFRAPSGPASGLSRCVCRWAAARPRAVRAASCCLLRAGVLGAGGPGGPRDRHTRACGSEWSISKPARAPPPPTGTATVLRVVGLPISSARSGTLNSGGTIALPDSTSVYGYEVVNQSS